MDLDDGGSYDSWIDGDDDVERVGHRTIHGYQAAFSVHDNMALIERGRHGKRRGIQYLDARYQA